MASNSAPVALELTHVLYDAHSHLAFALALITLSPILLMASYAALAVITRDLLIINMWAGQLACEAFNWILKRLVKQERPLESGGSGYGFPSSHSQYMGYFATFLILHLIFRHRFATTGNWMLDQLFRLIVYVGLVAWSAAVCYSRYHLTYHTSHQIIWGAGVGVGFGALTYLIAELIPAWWPKSPLGRLRIALLNHEIIVWLRIKDGWALWPDGGREEEWKTWRARWEAERLADSKKKL